MGVYAAGDVVRWENGLFAQSMRLEHWTSAAEQAATAVRNALSPDSPRAYETVPYFWSDWYDVRVQFVGVPEADETLVVEGDLATGDRLTVLYRLGDRLNGVLTVNGQADIMKYRRMIGQRATWAQGLEFAAERRAMREAKAVAHANEVGEPLRVFAGADAIAAAVGETIGPGEWIEVGQDRIDTFAEATGDHQWIHVDPVRAGDGPYGGTIAHGFLTLAMLPVLNAGLFRR